MRPGRKLGGSNHACATGAGLSKVRRPTAGHLLLLAGNQALLRGGDIELAREDVRRWGELVGTVPRFRVGYLRSLAVSAELEGDTKQAINYLQEAFTLTREMGLPGERWQILAKLGALYQLLGEAKRAFE